MKTKIIGITAVLMLSIIFTGFAQPEGLTQIAKESVLEMHRDLKKGIDALDKKKPEHRVPIIDQFLNQIVTGVANEKQFFIEESLIAKIYGGRPRKEYGLVDTYKKLNKKALSRKIDFEIDFNPDHVDFISEPRQSSDGRHYIFETKTEIKFVADDNRVKSSTKNELKMTWKVDLKNNRVEKTVLTSIVARPVSLIFSEKQKMKEASENKIAEYYQNLKNNRSAIEIPKGLQDMIDKGNGKIETEGNVLISEQQIASDEFRVNTVPIIKIHVDPSRYDPSLYEEPLEAYYLVNPTFDVSFKDNENGKVALVYSVSRLQEPNLRTAKKEPEKNVEPVVPVKEPEKTIAANVVPPAKNVPQKQTFPTGKEYYKVQIMAYNRKLEIKDLPQKYWIKDAIVEKYVVDGKDSWKCVVNASSLSEALAIRRELIGGGIEDAWIAVYENGERVRPYAGEPEITE